MCGILGASSPTNIDIDDIKLLYLASEQRGGHACGFVDNKVIIKSTKNAYSFVNEYITKQKPVEDSDGKKYKIPKKIKSFIGHTRFATYGAKDSIDNAHPFSMKTITGVHNGSIRNFHDLQELLETKYKVDSKLLLHMISDYGIEKTVPLLQGQLAVVYFDKTKKGDEIVIYRFDKPLYYGKKDETMFFASDDDYLKIIGCKFIKMFKEHTVYRVKMGSFLTSRSLKKKLSPRKPHTEPTRVTLDLLQEKRKYLERLEDKKIDEFLKEYDEKVEKFSYVKDELKVPAFAEQRKVTMMGKEHLFFWWFDATKTSVVTLDSTFMSVPEVIDLENEEDKTLLKDISGTVLYGEILSDFNRMKGKIKLRENFVSKNRHPNLK